MSTKKKPVNHQHKLKGQAFHDLAIAVREAGQQATVPWISYGNLAKICDEIGTKESKKE